MKRQGFSGFLLVMLSLSQVNPVRGQTLATTGDLEVQEAQSRSRRAARFPIRVYWAIWWLSRGPLGIYVG